MSKTPLSSRAPFTTADLAAVVVATPDEQAIILALNFLDWWLGPGPKGLELILAVLQGVPQLYGSQNPRTLKHMSETQAKRAVSSLKARGWLRTKRGFGGLAEFALSIPRMELEDAKDLVASRLSPDLVGKLGSSIEARVLRMKGKVPVYLPTDRPAPAPSQPELLEDDAETKSRKAKAAAAAGLAMLANELEEIWSTRWADKYKEAVLKARGRERGEFNNYAAENVQPAIFAAKVDAYLLQVDDYIVNARHSIFLLRSRWSQLAALQAPAAACSHPWEEFEVHKDYGLNVSGICRKCLKPLTRSKA